MNSKAKRQLENELMKMGLAGLKANGDPSGELVGQIAAMVNDWKGMENKFGEWVDRHLFFRDLLNECDYADRQEMYTALAPKLKFKVKPFAHYEALISEKAGKLVSQRRARVTGEMSKPIEIGRTKVRIVRKEESNCGWIILQCHQCEKQEKFLGETPVDAAWKARNAGWRRNVTLEQEACPECARKPMVLMQEGTA